MIRKLLAVTIAAMAIASVQGVASADPAPQKELCKNGGYADYVDPTTNLPFKNQGRCVSFVNAGGTLVPVEEEPPAPVGVQFALTAEPFLDVAVRVTGLNPAERVFITATSPPGGGIVLGYQTADADGSIEVLVGGLYGSCVPYSPLTIHVGRTGADGAHTQVDSEPLVVPGC